MKDQSFINQGDTAEDRAHASRLRFKQQMFLGIGGATVFGLVGALGTKLLGVLGSGMLPIIGLAALAVVGVGCIYLGSRFWNESIRMDQENQARKISQMTSLGRDQAPVIAPETPERPVTAPPGIGADRDQAEEKEQAESAARSDRPGTRISHAAALDKIQSEQGLTVH